MAIFRSFSEIVNSILERLRLTQPNLDTKPGTVSRDLFVDIPADQIEKLHGSLLLVSEKQSPDSAKGKDLERWASNFGMSKNSGSPSNGIAVFTVNDIVGDIPIPANTGVFSRNGLQFKTIGNYIMTSAEKNRFSATASRLRSALNLAGINDSYAIEVPVRAINSGSSGNISSFQLIEHTLSDGLKITNLKSFNGGTNEESDAAFKSRIFAIFSGSNTGTSFGYRNAAISVSGVNDAVVIEPGNTLMLRDGTETIEVNDGSFRILNSGTGGKVDLYILGKKTEEIVESYIFTDKSGSGSASDERNDFILGQSNVDITLTSEERRVKAFKNGILPLQPAESIISVIGSSSGIFAEKSLDSNGNVVGNFELVKDNNVETGGSPFGFDKIKFISSYKEVDAESVIKQSENSVDALRFTGTSDILNVFQDISIVGENSSVSSADRRLIKLNHYPITTVTRIVNKTTGEVYVVESQNINSETGTNTSGEVYISGKTLPSSADVLSVDYVWRLYFDKFIDFNGEYTGVQFKDSSVSDSIDWGVSNGVFSEKSVIERDQSGIEYQIQVANNISRVVSVYSALTTTATLSLVNGSDGDQVLGLEISSGDDAIDDIVSIKSSSGVELYKTITDDGSFSGRTIYLPSDCPADISGVATVIYNKIEFFNISNGDGSHSNDIITLPSTDILSGNDVLSNVDSAFLTEEEVFIDYVAEITNLLPSQSFTSLPVSGSDYSNSLLNSNLSTVTGSNQPVFYKFNSEGSIYGIERFGPTRLSVIVSGITKPGKIKINGTSLTRYELVITAGNSISGRVFDLGLAIRSSLNLTSIPNNIGIARVDLVTSLNDSNKTFELMGQKLHTNLYGFGLVETDESLKNYHFELPNTATNNALSFSEGEKIIVNCLIYNSNDFEDLYFATNSKVITNKQFFKINKVSVSSGFKSPSGSLIGSLIINPTSQPGSNTSYFVNYKFKAPVEGERITVRYNLNRLISDVTANLESVRSITADVLVKEAPTITVNIKGEVIINENVLSETSTILENVSNSVSNLLNSTTLGGTIDYSDVINAATSVSGVDSVNISLFNEDGSSGRKSFIKALDNESIEAGEIIFVSISRKDFRIT